MCHAMISTVVKENQMLGVSKTHDLMRSLAAEQCGTSLVTGGKVLLQTVST